MRLETICFAAEMPMDSTIHEVEAVHDGLSEAFNKWAKEMNIKPEHYISSDNIVVDETLALRVIYKVVQD